MTEESRQSGLVSRYEFDGYRDRHEADPDAHGAMRYRQSQSQEEDLQKLDNRIRSLETWRIFTAGGLAVIAIEITGGGLLVLAHLAHWI